MENLKSDTKQKIKEIALTLFSQRGFSAVSIRDICREVGIKESTIYYHFKNKQHIYDELLADFKTKTLKMENDFNIEFSKVSNIEREPFILVGLAFFNEFLLNEKILKLLRMLMIEQQNNIKAASLLRQVLIENPLQKNEKVFKVMIEKGCFNGTDAKKAAEEYYAPIFLAYERYFSTGEDNETDKNEADAMVEAHLSDFYERYFVERKDDNFESIQK